MNEVDTSNFSLILLDENNRPVLAKDFERVLDGFQSNADEANKLLGNFKEELLKAMLQFQLYQAKTEKYTVSVVFPKNTIMFDGDRFIATENEDIVDAFTKLVEIDPVFDIDKFSEEHPDLYEKYLVKSHIVVDTKKLEQVMPEVFKRYATEIKTTKAPTIRIATNKEAKK